MQNYIDEIVKALLDGELVALPTETVYGLAANALNSTAVRKIFEVKGRPFIDPLIVHTYDLSQADTLASIPEVAFKLSETFWPGPLTIVLPKKPIVPDIVTAGLQSVGIRVPKHPIFRDILLASQLPLAAPSANPFGYLSPTETHHVKKTLGSKIQYIVDGGPCEIGLESTILNLLDPQNPEILRPGPISADDLEYVFGFKPKYASNTPHTGAQLAPGLLKSHYSPHAQVKLFQPGETPNISDLQTPSALVFLKRPASIDNTNAPNTFWLSETGNLNEVSKNLFSLLERLDNQGVKTISIELAPKQGIGIAICNRLERASQKTTQLN